LVRWVSPSKTKEIPNLGFGERVSPSKTKEVPIDEKGRSLKTTP